MRAGVALTDGTVAAAGRHWPSARLSAPTLRGAFAAAGSGVDALLVLNAFALPSLVGRLVPEGLADRRVAEPAVWIAATAALLAVGLLASHGLYDLESTQRWYARLYAITSSICIAFVVSGVLSVAVGAPLAVSGSVVGAAFAVPGVVAWHAWLARGYAALSGAVVPAARAIVVGANAAGAEAARELGRRGYQVVGYADDAEPPTDNEGPLLGPVARLGELVEGLGIDELVIALPADRRGQLARVLTRGFSRHVRVKYAAEFADLLPLRFDVRVIAGRPFIDYAPVARVVWLKRAIDVTFAVAGLVALLPLMAAVAVAIKVDSRGPVFHRQLRVGKDGRRFRMLKFRSMRVDAETLLGALMQRNEVSGPMFKIRSDPRITRVGRFLRRYSVDELPQLINVLKGEMSLVGPRPPLPAEVERYEDWELGRLRAIPGITGLWQVSGRTNVEFEDMVRLDLHYIRNWSLALDLEILLRTIPAVLSSKGAY